ncbi:MAG: YceI family protein [Gammaproteobacteria bacterium]|nr:YceI family protein [Gammaproteobacteria bacterium]
MAIIHFFKNLIAILIMIFVPMIVVAAVSTWQIIPTESTLTFTGTLNNAPTLGQFKSFNGEIHFDPDKLNESDVQIVVDIASITTSYPDIANTLKMPDWFDVKMFPQAVFKASKFNKMGDKSYQANGELTIRDKTIPVTISFTEEDLPQNKVRIKGNTILKRTQFNVGQGEWADTDSVKDEVKVEFNLMAIKK